MTAQLAEGFLVTVQIFVLTLFSAAWHVGGIWAHVQMQNNKADCKALHLCYERNTFDAADYRSIFCTIFKGGLHEQHGYLHKRHSFRHERSAAASLSVS